MQKDLSTIVSLLVLPPTAHFNIKQNLTVHHEIGQDANSTILFYILIQSTRNENFLPVVFGNVLRGRQDTKTQNTQKEQPRSFWQYHHYR